MHVRNVLLLLAIACKSGTQVAPLSDSGAAYVPGTSWRTANPASAGLDPAAMSALRDDVTGTRFGRIHGVVIVRFGHLVHEQYNGWDAARPHTMQSVTKSVTSLLYGIAAAKTGAPASVDRPVLDVFSRYQSIANVDARKSALTMRHLLTMRTGMDFWEQPYPDSPLDSMNNSRGDWVRFVLDRRMIDAPDARWAYNSGAAIVTCGAIRELTGERPDDFARRELFAPIGASGETWFRSPFDQLPHCGGGLSLTATDLARVGYLVLRHGRWGDRQIVPAAWIDEATRSYSSGSSVFFSHYGAQYGYYWWLFPLARGGAGTEIIAASGSGGQWLFVVPAYDLVVAIIGESANGLDLLYDRILPAIRAR